MFYRAKVLGGLLSVNSPVLLSVLHLGSGFGLTVTKQTSDPDVLHKQQNASTWAAAPRDVASPSWSRATQYQWGEQCTNATVNICTPANKQQPDWSLWFTQSRLTVSTDWVNWVKLGLCASQCSGGTMWNIWAWHGVTYVYLKIQLVIMSSISQPMKHWRNNWWCL